MNLRVFSLIAICTLFMAIGCSRNKPKKPSVLWTPPQPTAPSTPSPTTPTEQSGSTQPNSPHAQNSPDGDELRPRPRPKPGASPTNPNPVTESTPKPAPAENPAHPPTPDLAKNVWKQADALLADLMAQPGSVMITAPMSAPILAVNDEKTVEEQVMNSLQGNAEIRIRRSTGQKQDGTSSPLGMGSFAVIAPKQVTKSTVANIRTDLQSTLAIGCDQPQLDHIRILGNPEATAQIPDFADIPGEFIAPEPQTSTTFNGNGSPKTLRIQAAHVYLCGQLAVPQHGLSIEAKTAIFSSLNIQSVIATDAVFSFNVKTNRFYIIGGNQLTTRPALPSSRPAFIGLIVSNEFAGDANAGFQINLLGWVNP